MARKTKPIGNDYCLPVSIEEFERQARDNLVGRDPLGDSQPERPTATRTTARPWTETDNRKPFLPTEDVSTPSLEDGVSFRQSF